MKHVSKYELWQPKHPGEILNKVALAPLLKEVTEPSPESVTLANCFASLTFYA
jgi:hypothetical protein